MREHLQAIVTVLSLVNPVVCGAMSARIEANYSRSKQMADATNAALAILAILALAALVGTRLLDLLASPSMPSWWRVAVLAWIGFSMLSGRGLSRSPDASANAKASLTPLILFAASPGTITGVITIAAAHTRLGFPVTALAAIAVASVVTWVLMLLVMRVVGKEGGGGFARDILTSLMGPIVLSMGFQFALTGLRQFGI